MNRASAELWRRCEAAELHFTGGGPGLVVARRMVLPVSDEHPYEKQGLDAGEAQSATCAGSKLSRQVAAQKPRTHDRVEKSRCVSTGETSRHPWRLPEHSAAHRRWRCQNFRRDSPIRNSCRRELRDRGSKNPDRCLIGGEKRTQSRPLARSMANWMARRRILRTTSGAVNFQAHRQLPFSGQRSPRSNSIRRRSVNASGDVARWDGRSQ